MGSAWELLRQRDNILDNFQQLWIKGAPFKVSFFFWRLWKQRLSIGEVLSFVYAEFKRLEDGVNLVTKAI